MITITSLLLIGVTIRHRSITLSELSRVISTRTGTSRYSSAFRFTFLREPVDNLISIYYFWLTYPFDGYPAHRRFLDERPTIFEFADTRK